MKLSKFSLKIEELNQHFDAITELMMNFNSESFYNELAQKFPWASFCRFSCILLGRCPKASIQLENAIIEYIKEKVCSRNNLIPFFEGVDESACKIALEKVPEVETKMFGAVLEILKSIHNKKTDFRNFRDKNPMFRMCLNSFLQNEAKNHFQVIYDSFAKIFYNGNKKRFIKSISKIDSNLFQEVMARWFNDIVALYNIEDAKIYFEITFRKIVSQELGTEILENNLIKIKQRLSIVKISSIYNYLERLSKDRESPPNLTKTLKKHRKAILGDCQIRFDERSWEDYLKIVPDSKFSKQFLAKMVTAFDEEVDRARIESSMSFRTRVSSTSQLSERENDILRRFAEQTKARVDAEQDYDGKTEMQRLVVINKLYKHEKSMNIWSKILKAYKSTPALKKHLLKSKLIGLLLAFAEKVLSGNLGIDQMFLINHFNLRIPLKASLIFSVEKELESGSQTRETEEFSQKRMLFESGLKDMEEKVELLREVEQILQTLKNEPLFCDLFDLKTISKNAVTSAETKYLRNLSKVLKSGHARLSRVQPSKMEILKNCVKKRIFLLLCFERGFFSVFSNSCRLPAEELELLRRYFDFGQKELPTQSVYLEFAQFKGMLEDAEKYYSHLNSKYIEPGLEAVNWNGQCEAGMGFPENPLLFDFLLRDAGPDCGTRDKPQDGSAEQPKAALLKTKIAELTDFQSLRRSLRKLPGQLQSTVKEHIRHMGELANDLTRRQCPLEKLYHLEPKILAKVAKLHELAQSPGLAEVFMDELKQEIATICTDPLNSVKTESELEGCDPDALASLMRDDPEGVVAGLIISRIKKQEVVLCPLKTALSQKQNECTLLEKSNQKANSQNKNLTARAAQLEKNKDELVRQNTELLNHLHRIVKLTVLASHFAPPGK